MADGSSFEMDPEQVAVGISILTDLGTTAWGILKDFDTMMADTSWTGSDSNGKKIRANFVENRDATSGSLSSLAEALERTGEATLMNVQTTQGTQDAITDGIDEEAGNYGARRG
jgi:hypothetical protein